jgi:hypothetical protein
MKKSWLPIQKTRWAFPPPLGILIQDGSSNLDELRNGTDPANPDTDGDGWLDSAEVKTGSDPLQLVSTLKNA